MPEFYDCLRKDALMRPHFTEWYASNGFSGISRKDKDMNAQREYNVDVIAYRGKEKFFIDEKNTYRPYGYHELPIETFSKLEEKKLGWLHTSIANYLLWAIRPDQEKWGVVSEFVLMPFDDGVKAWLKKNIEQGKWILQTTQNFDQEGKLIYKTQFARVQRRDINEFLESRRGGVQTKLSKNWWCIL